ncbi:uncharacterized protein [Physcomitrium patens]|uniref:uncharacterized protein isoform X3 n=1 Tax=Physcomitrium patens TaxID=3218 RepID=UPI003CCD6FE6
MLTTQDSGSKDSCLCGSLAALEMLPKLVIATWLEGKGRSILVHLQNAEAFLVPALPVKHRDVIVVKVEEFFWRRVPTVWKHFCFH